jgi:hypothetical protein
MNSGRDETSAVDPDGDAKDPELILNCAYNESFFGARLQQDVSKAFKRAENQE